MDPSVEFGGSRLKVGRLEWEYVLCECSKKE